MKYYAIIENEKFAVVNLRNMLLRHRPDYTCSFIAESVEEGVKALSSGGQLDLIFMDIELNDGNCFDIFDKVKVDTPVIFTTAYDQYALKAFEVNSVDYLLKPISHEALVNALNKYERRIPYFADYAKLAEMLLSNIRQEKRRILIQSGDNYSFCYLENVAYFIRDERYVYAAIGEVRRGLTDFINLKEVEKMVEGYNFFQLSRNIIANISSIMKVSKWFAGRLLVTVGSGRNEEKVIISVARKNDFLKWLGAH